MKVECKVGGLLWLYVCKVTQMEWEVIKGLRSEGMPKVIFFSWEVFRGCSRVKRSDWVRSGDGLGAKRGRRG